jgi:hypothetical protein
VSHRGRWDGCGHNPIDQNRCRPNSAPSPRRPGYRCAHRPRRRFRCVGWVMALLERSPKLQPCTRRARSSRWPENIERPRHSLPRSRSRSHCCCNARFDCPGSATLRFHTRARAVAPRLRQTGPRPMAESQRLGAAEARVEEAVGAGARGDFAALGPRQLRLVFRCHPRLLDCHSRGCHRSRHPSKPARVW